MIVEETEAPAFWRSDVAPAVWQTRTAHGARKRLGCASQIIRRSHSRIRARTGAAMPSGVHSLEVGAFLRVAKRG